MYRVDDRRPRQLLEPVFECRMQFYQYTLVGPVNCSECSSSYVAYIKQYARSAGFVIVLPVLQIVLYSSAPDTDIGPVYGVLILSAL